MNDLPVIDESSLDRLREWGGEALIGKMIRIFVDHTPTRMEEIRRGIETGEIRETEKGAHSLKSSAGNLGAHRLRDVCTRIENFAEEGDADAAAALIPEVETAHREATEALTRLLEELDADQDEAGAR